MQRIAILLFLMLAPDPHQQVYELFTGMAAALSDSNITGFMNGFDPAMPGYQQLRTGVAALLKEAEVVSSVEVLRDEGGDTRRTVELDWIVEIRPLSDFAPLERRRCTIKCEVARRSKGWVVTSLAPLEFFGP